MIDGKLESGLFISQELDLTLTRFSLYQLLYFRLEETEEILCQVYQFCLFGRVCQLLLHKQRDQIRMEIENQNLQEQIMSELQNLEIVRYLLPISRKFLALLAFLKSFRLE